MKKHNSVKVGKNVKKSPITAGDGNIVVTGNETTGNNNKIIIIVKQLIKFRYMIPALILVFIALYLIQKPPITNVNITNVPAVPTKEEVKPPLNPFKEGIYGIIVAQFNGNTEEQKNKGKEIQATIQSTLNARFKELGINDADAKKTPDLFESHDQARDFGKKYQAQLVIWGDVTLQGIIPNITIVNENSVASALMKPETAILKDSLTHTALAEIKDIRLPALTDEPTKLVCFVTGQRYFFKGNFEKAVEYFTYSLDEQIDHYIDNTPILFYRGITLSVLNRYDKAIDDYTKIIALNPKYDLAYNNRGITYSYKDEYDKAIDDFNQAISLNPNLYTRYNNRGITYSHKGEYDKAIEDFNQTISMNPKFYITYYKRGITYFDKGKYDKAIEDFSRTISLNPRDHTIYFRRGGAYEKQGIYDKAIDDYNQAIKLTPQFSSELSKPYNNMSYLFATCPDDKYRNGQKALESEPNNFAFLDTLAAEAGKFDDAVKTQEKAIKMLSEKG